MLDAEVLQLIIDNHVPFEYDGLGNYTLSSRSLRVLFEKVEKSTKEVEKEPVFREPKEIATDKPISRGQREIVVERTHIEKAENKPSAETPEEKRRGRKTQIDSGKIMALHNAGWDTDKIMDEMGCSRSTVLRIVRGYKG